jgi:hypothetical protein
MTLTLHVDGARWRANQAAVLSDTPGLVPVIKGNGYGFGRSRLAARAAELGVGAVALGTTAELDDVAPHFDRDVLVLQPYLPAVDGDLPAVEASDARVIRTVASLDGLHGLTGRRVVVEVLSSVQRFGFTRAQLGLLGPLLEAVTLEGFALHLPMERGLRSHVEEVADALSALRSADLTPSTLWVSHLTPAELGELGAAHPDVALRSRVGTRLWLGDRGAAVVRASVLAAHPLRKGDRYGYRQRKAPGTGTLLVVSGGTAHGIALSAPTSPGGIVQRVKVAGIGSLEAVGRSLSPFHVDGGQRWFAEPPHMQMSLLWLPEGVTVPPVGSEVDVDVRMTTTAVDRVVEV